MAKTLIAFYSRRGQNYVNGSIRNLEKGNNEVIVEKIKAPSAKRRLSIVWDRHSPGFHRCSSRSDGELRNLGLILRPSRQAKNTAGSAAIPKSADLFV